MLQNMIKELFGRLLEKNSVFMGYFDCLFFSFLSYNSQ